MALANCQRWIQAHASADASVAQAEGVLEEGAKNK